MIQNVPKFSDAKVNGAELRLFNCYTSRSLDGDGAKYRTYLRIGTQVFALDRLDDTKDEADWARAMLARGLDEIIADSAWSYRVYRRVVAWLEKHS